MHDCVILVGGKGKRLGSITKKTPKPLIKINNIPFLNYLILHIAKFKISKIYLIGNYKFNQLEKLYNKKKIYNIPIETIKEQSPKDTGGCLYEIKKKIKRDFFLMNGDSFVDLDLDKFYSFAKNKKNLINLAIIKNKSYKSNKKLSSINIKKNKIILSTKSKYMNSGVYFVKKEFLKKISSPQKISLENNIIPNLIKKNKVGGFIHKSKIFIDIGLKKNLKLAKQKLKLIKKNPAVLFDRDGVLNEDRGYIYKKKDLKILNGAPDSIKYLNKKKILAIVVTNQAGIGRGFYSEKDLHNFHFFFQKKLKKFNASIDNFYFCPFHKDAGKGKYKKDSFFRKPNPGMLLQAINEFNINKIKCLMIGDKLTDKQAALKAGVKFFFKDRKSLYTQLKENLKSIKL